MRIALPSLRSFRFGLVGAVIAAGLAALGSDVPSSGFSGTLSSDEKAASGVSLLSPAQTAALDTLVARDVSLAREGDVSGFSTTFLQRRTANERKSAGLDRLTDDQRSRLNTLVARAIATQPFGGASFVYQPKPAVPVTSLKPPGPEVHGDLAFTVGGGKGGSFYGTSMDLNLVDPDGRYSLTVGYSYFRGKGLWYPCPPFGP